MTGKIAHCAHLYELVESRKLSLERMENELRHHVSLLTEEELAEYVPVTDRIDTKVERKRGKTS